MPQKSTGGRVEILVSPDGRVLIAAQLQGRLFKEKNSWVSYCPSLDLSTCAETKEQVLERTQEAIYLFFDSCVRRGTLGQALEELHWTRHEQIALDGLTKKCSRQASVFPELRVALPSIHAGNTWTSQAELACG